MFNNIIRYYNQNRKKVITIIVSAIAVIVLIQVLNQISKMQLEEEAKNRQNTINTSTAGDKSANTLHTDSIMSGVEITTETAKQNQSLINDFIEYCNNGNIELAYSLLSEECKEELFTNLSEFKSKYHDKIFSSKKQYNIQNLYTSTFGETYKITYVGDLLSSGNISDNIEDYITVNSENKLNIFRYIANVKINKTGSNDVATISIIDKDVYDDYEIYNIKVKNNSSDTIMLNRSQDNDGIYVTYSGSNTKYTAFITDIYEQNLILEKNQEKYLSIKINKIYNGNTTAQKIVFSDIINNKNQFDMTSDKNKYTNTSSIEINL